MTQTTHAVQQQGKRRRVADPSSKALKVDATARVVDAPCASARDVRAEADGLKPIAEVEVLPKLFRVLDNVLMHLAHRGRRAFFEDVKIEVETLSGHSFSHERLGCILALVSGQITVAWAPESGVPGERAVSFSEWRLELQQCNANGEFQAPSIYDLPDREAAFVAELAAAKSRGGELPRVDLPPQPTATAVTRKQFLQESSMQLNPQEVPLRRKVPYGSSTADRKAAMRERIRQREAVDQAHAAAKAVVDEHKKNITACDHALKALAVVSSVLSPPREQVREEEMLDLLCKRSRIGLSDVDARDALQKIVLSGTWLSCTPSQFEKDVFYFRRTPGVFSSSVVSALRAERAETERVFRIETIEPPVASQNIASEEVLAKDAAEPDGSPAAVVREESTVPAAENASASVGSTSKVLDSVSSVSIGANPTKDPLAMMSMELTDAMGTPVTARRLRLCSKGPARHNASIGQRVTLHALKARPDLNGRGGVLQAWIATKSRWEVDVEGMGVVNLRQENLILVES